MRRDRRDDLIAGLWGFGEATLFFIVPDVWLSWLALRSPRVALRACLWAIAGALIGGTAMYVAGTNALPATEFLLCRVPGVHASMLTLVREQIAQHGLWAVLQGPIAGRPYKIYAVEWAGTRGSFIPFLLVSVPARAVRFLLSVATCALIRVLFRSNSYRGIEIAHIAWALVWTASYATYFRIVGW